MEGFIGIAVAGIMALLGAYMIVTGTAAFCMATTTPLPPESERPRLARAVGWRCWSR